MSFNINPVKAVAKAHEKGTCGIQSMNSACYEICAAFKGVDSPWTISDQCEQQCGEFVNKLRKETYGLGYCDHHAPNRPVIWNQTPNFFPDQFRKYKDVNTALKASLALCDDTKYPLQCREKAIMHSYAVDGGGKISESYRRDRDRDDDPDFDKYEKSNPWSFWIGFGVAGIFFVIMIVILVKVIINK